MKKRILHVEDDGDTTLLVKTLLEKRGYCVSTASNGRECLDLLKEGGVDLVLLDIMLPDMDGWDIFREIRKDPQNNDVKIAFMSVIPVSDWKMDSLNKSGVEDYITKPFDSEDLIRRVAGILE